MVEVVLTCQGVLPNHEFTKTWTGDKINWDEVCMWLRSPDPRCDLHPQWSHHHYEE